MLRKKFTRADAESTRFDVVILGGGATGLFLGALQSLAGNRVLILEQNEVLGGGLHTFGKGYGRPEHDTGLHYVGTQFFLELGRLLGTFPKFRTINSTPGSFDEVYDVYTGPDFEWKLAAGRKNFISSLGKLLSGGEKQARAYLSHIQWTARWTRLSFILRAAQQTWFSKRWRQLMEWQKWLLGRRQTLTVVEYMTQVLKFTDRDKRITLSMCFNYGDPATTSWMVHAGVVDHFLDGASYPEGGPSNISALCLDLIRKGWGQALCQVSVEGVIVKNMPKDEAAVVGLKVRTSRQEDFVMHFKPSTKFVSTLGSDQLDRLLDRPVSDVLDRRPGFYFLFVEFDLPNPSQSRSANTWITCDPPPACKGGNNNRLFVSSGTLKSNIDPGEGKIPGRYSATVIAAGTEEPLPCERAMWDAFDQVYPEAVVARSFTGDPGTCRKYLGRRAPYGMVADPARLEDPRTATRTDISNLYRAGQDSLLPGIAGALGSAEITHFVLTHSPKRTN